METTLKWHSMMGVVVRYKRPPAVDYTSLLEAGGTFDIDNGEFQVNPPIMWNNSNEHGVASWLLNPGSTKKYKFAQRGTDRGTKWVADALRGGDFGVGFRDSNQLYYTKQSERQQDLGRGAHFNRDITNCLLYTSDAADE